MRVFLDNSFLNVRQESTLRPWKGSPFLQQAVVKDNLKELIRCIGDLGFNCSEVNLLEKWGNKQEEPSWVQNESLPQAFLRCHLLNEMNLDPLI